MTQRDVTAETFVPASATELEQVSFKTSPDQLSAVEALARKHQRTLSGEIRMALETWIMEHTP